MVCDFPCRAGRRRGCPFLWLGRMPTASPAAGRIGSRCDPAAQAFSSGGSPGPRSTERSLFTLMPVDWPGLVPLPVRARGFCRDRRGRPGGLRSITPEEICSAMFADRSSLMWRPECGWPVVPEAGVPTGERTPHIAAILLDQPQARLHTSPRLGFRRCLSLIFGAGMLPARAS